MKKFTSLMVLLMSLSLCSCGGNKANEETNKEPETNQPGGDTEGGETEGGDQPGGNTDPDQGGGTEGGDQPGGNIDPDQGGGNEGGGTEGGDQPGGNTDPDQGGGDQPGGGTEGGGTEGGETGPGQGGDTEGGETTTTLTTIAQVKAKTEEIIAAKGEESIYVSDIPVELKNLQLIDSQDMISGNEYYQGYNFKLFLTDGTDFINIACDMSGYGSTSDNEFKHQKYDISGTVGYFNNQVEVFAKGKNGVKWLEDSTSEDFSYMDKAEEVTLDKFYTNLEALKLNDKGVAYGDKLYKVKAKCLARDVNDAEENLIFGVGTRILHLHGNRYIKTQEHFEVGKSYMLAGYMASYRYRFSMIFADKEILTEDVAFDEANLETIEIADLYKYNFESDSKERHPSNITYSRYLTKGYKASGYFSFTKISKNRTDGVFDDKEVGYIKNKNEKDYISIDTAKLRKAAVIVNDIYINHRGTNENDLSSHIDEYVNVTLLPYEWNTKKYPTMYIYSYDFPAGPIA